MIPGLTDLTKGLIAILTLRIITELFTALAALTTYVHVICTVNLIAAIALLEVLVVDGLAVFAVLAGTAFHCTGLLETSTLTLCRQRTL